MNPDINTFLSTYNCIIVSPLSSKLNIIKILSSKYYKINPKHLITIYNALILSLFNYSMLPYIISSKKIKHGLQVIQNKALRTIYKLNIRTKTNLIHAIANKETVENILKKQAKKYLLKAIQYNINIESLVNNREMNNNNSKHKTLLDFIL